MTNQQNKLSDIKKSAHRKGMFLSAVFMIAYTVCMWEGKFVKDYVFLIMLAICILAMFIASIFITHSKNQNAVIINLNHGYFILYSATILLGCLAITAIFFTQFLFANNLHFFLSSIGMITIIVELGILKIYFEQQDKLYSKYDNIGKVTEKKPKKQYFHDRPM